MATAEELLANTSQTSAVLVADLNTRIISIPASIRVLGVESDDDTRHLKFNVPQYYEDLDLSDFKIQINFENARGRGDFYLVKDVEILDGMLSFVWEVDRSAFEYEGDVEFNICMKKYDDTGVIERELNTTPATLPVLRGLETTKEVVENNPSAFDSVLFRLYAVEAATGNGQNGHYSIVKVTENDDGVLFTIANTDGTTSAFVKHGRDAVTPELGVDYWTEDDKNEITNKAVEVSKSYVDNWAPTYLELTLLHDQWVENTQVIEHARFTEESIVFVSPIATEPNDTDYAKHGVRCIMQEDGKLTFACSTVPTRNIHINVAVYHGVNEYEAGSGGLTVIDDGDGNVTIL